MMKVAALDRSKQAARSHYGRIRGPSVRDNDGPAAPKQLDNSPDVGEESPLVPEQDHEAIVTLEEERAPTLKFPVVALGASAGGLEAFTRVLRRLPADTGMAFVLIQHLAPQHISQLSSLLARETSMPVIEVEHGTPVQPNHVFVIPPNKLMSISRGLLDLAPRLESTGVPMPIDHFFRSLARDQRGGAIGVVLSGMDSDGALGLQAIREEGGLAIAQSEDSAKFAGMPHNAAGAGPVDLILPPEAIAGELARIGRQPPAIQELTRGTGDGEPPDDRQLNTILALLRKATGIDFREYRRGVLRRRIARRMLLQRQSGLEQYAAHLRTNDPELMALYEDILINVTSFFRDPDTFRALENQILPALLRNASPNAPIHVWVPGCSTGQEVYSVAMCLIESVSKLGSPVAIQLFGTDLSERVLLKARSAVYQENELAPLSDERRRRFFVQVENGYRIVKSVREVCVFARQNVGVDPPFSRLNLISCRNLLIYFRPALQRRVIATFHYALQPGGYLMLGSSEALRGFPALFSSVDKQYKFFQRNALGQPNLETIRRGFAKESSGHPSAFEGTLDPEASKFDFEKAAERIILREHGPAWVVVNERLEIIHARGDTSAFLQLPAGAPSFELLKMARDSLRGELRKLLAKAKDENFAIQSKIIRETSGGETRRIGLEVRRFPSQPFERPYFLVVFSSRPERMEQQESDPELDLVQSGPASQPETALLQEELALTSQRLQAIIAERDTANQELTSAIEEAQSSNEELQSINEELETAKEELQSSNEELSTLNEELQNSNQELGRIGDDLSNLMSSTTIPILLLDNDLRIRRMTPVAESILGIRPSDVGRRVGDIRMRLSVEDVESLAQKVLVTLNPRELELQDREGSWRELRLRPYRTADNRIEGVVLVLVDIDQLRRAKEQANAARQFAEAVIEAVQIPLLVLRSDLRIRLANRAFYEDYGLQPADVENQLFLEMSRKQWDLPGLRSALKEVLTKGVSKELEFESHFGDQGSKSVCIHLRSVQADGETLILVAIEEITAQKAAERILVARQEQLKASVEAGTAALHESEAALIRSRGELRDLAASLLNAQESERRRISRELHDDLSQKVAKLQFDIEILEQNVPFADTEDARKRLQSVRDQTATLANDLRRVAHGLHPSSLDHLGLTVALRSYTEEFSRSTAVQVQFTSRKVPREIPVEIASCLYRIVQEALRNVGKHASSAEVEVKLVGKPNRLDLSIRDNGEGFDMEAVRAKGGLGLISMQERVRLVQGRFSLKAEPGHGVHISVQVPLHPEKL